MFRARDIFLPNPSHGEEEAVAWRSVRGAGMKVYEGPLLGLAPDFRFGNSRSVIMYLWFKFACSTRTRISCATG